MRLLVVMDPPGRIHAATDTTLVIVEEARARGHEVELCTADRLEIDRGQVRALVERVIRADRALEPCLQTVPVGRRLLAEYQAVLMRKDPPFDTAYYFATLLLERARGQTLLVNDPRALREANEKLFIFEFPELVPPTRVTSDLAELKAFLVEHGGQMIVKPLDACGGTGVFHVRADDRNTNVIFETITELGTKAVMAQAYLPEAREGDKRILLLDGEPLGAVLRVPRPDETRGNLHAGGTATHTELTARDLEICTRLGPRLRELGLYFVGIDVIGGRLTEINVTSPTGVQEIDRLEGVRLEARIVDWLEARTALPL